MNSGIEHLDVDLEKIIDDVLLIKIKNNDRDYTYFHPSEFHQCHRKLVYKFYEDANIFKVVDPPFSTISPQLQRIFDNGHHMHFRLGANLVDSGRLKGRWFCPVCKKTYGKKEKLGVLKPTQCNCGSKKFNYQEVGFRDEDTLLGGHVDAILDLTGLNVNGHDVPEDASEEDSHIVIDFKSMRSEAFRRLIGPKPEHIVQMQIYLFLSGLKCGKFLYENKNDQQFRQFIVPRDETVIAQHAEEAKSLKSIVNSVNSKGEKTLPVRAYTKSNHKECIECRYRKHCWGK